MARPRKESNALDPMRSCHDCGKPTRDYRCPACQKKHLSLWRKAQCMRSKDEADEDDTFPLPPFLQPEF